VNESGTSAKIAAMFSAVRVRRPTVPLPLGWAVRRARELADPIALRRTGGPSVPPRRLRARTGAPGVSEFVAGGAAAAGELLEGGLSAAGVSVDGLGSVLDLGCGSGRVLPVAAARLPPDARCVGCDVDAAAIAWDRRRWPSLEWERTGFDPPLPFPGGSFDLVYSISVFSHLDERLSDAWAAEVERVLAPGGVALLSVHGASAFEQFRTGAVSTAWCRRGAFDRGPLGAGEFAFVPYRRSIWNEGELPGVGGEYGLAFHGGSYVRSRWSAMFDVFDVVDVLERAITGWQDLVVCRKLMQAG
jgi:SAM-dependent methyltransferase